MRLKPQAAGQPLANVPDRTDQANANMAIGLAVLLFLGIVGVICASLLA
jgi:hypothetical protein